jgi:hypothetical protein
MKLTTLRGQGGLLAWRHPDYLVAIPVDNLPAIRRFW